MSKENYKSNVAFIDLLFNIVVGITFLFIIAFILINPQNKPADVPSKAEYMVVLTWADDSLDDVDLWVKGPDGPPVGYLRSNSGLLNYERDDRGRRTDTTVVDGQQISVETNMENVTLRGIVPGKYLVGAHLYSNRSNTPTKVTVRVIKVNPYHVVYTQQATLQAEGSVHDFYRFTITPNGQVTNVSHSLQSAVPYGGDKERIQQQARENNYSGRDREYQTDQGP